MTKTTKIVYAGLLVLIAALLAVGGVFDLTIANNVYQPDNVVARILELVGYLPPFLLVAATFAVLFYRVKEDASRRALKKVAAAACVPLAYLVFGYMMSGEVMTVLWQRALVAVGSAAVLTAPTFLFFRRRSDEQLKRYEIFLIFATIVCVISSLLTINVVKFLWGRARYREMMAAEDYLFEAFTPWYHANGFTLHGHHSFPSGHTCAATNLLTLLALEEVFPSVASKKKSLTFVVALYIFILAYSRMVLGAHFLSDVTAGFTIGFVTYAVARYLYFDKSRIVISALLGLNGEREDGSEKVESAVGSTEVASAPAERIEIEIPETDSEETAPEAGESETPAGND